MASACRRPTTLNSCCSDHTGCWSSLLTPSSATLLLLVLASTAPFPPGVLLRCVCFCRCCCSGPHNAAFVRWPCRHSSSSNNTHVDKGCVKQREVAQQGSEPASMPLLQHHVRGSSYKHHLHLARKRIQIAAYSFECRHQALKPGCLLFALSKSNVQQC